MSTDFVGDCPVTTSAAERRFAIFAPVKGGDDVAPETLGSKRAFSVE